MSRRTRANLLRAIYEESRRLQIDQEIFGSAIAEVAGLNRTSWRCLDILGVRGSMTAGELAAAAHLTTGAVTAVVDQLEARRFVRRSRDSRDGRVVILEVTDEARQAGAPIYEPMRSDSATALHDFTTAELEIVLEFLGRQRTLLMKQSERVHGMLANTVLIGHPRARAVR